MARIIYETNTMNAAKEIPEQPKLGPEEISDGFHPALLFIPDISGFTKFVCGTDPNISKTLIADLLDLIIESNIIGLETCEIQGDAILFYKIGPPPTIEEITNQCKQIFLDFQNYLYVAQRSLGDVAGTLLSESNLTLKIIVHYGLISTTRIHHHIKLMGKDVITAHRLLKNSVPGSEYVLLSEDYLKTQSEENIDKSFKWTQLNNAEAEYEHLGIVQYRYAHLTPLRLMVGDNHIVETENDLTHQIVLDVNINVPSRFVLRILKSVPLRPQWVPDMESITYNLEKADRLNTSYICHMKRGIMEVQALRSFYSDEGIEYVEKISNLKAFPNSLVFYFIRETENGTEVKMEFRYSRAGKSKNVPSMFARKWMKRFLCNSLIGLQRLCEKYYGQQAVPVKAE